MLSRCCTRRHERAGLLSVGQLWRRPNNPFSLIGRCHFLTSNHLTAQPIGRRDNRTVAATDNGCWRQPLLETVMATSSEPSQTNRIRALNDDLRQNLSHGRAVMTSGVAALGPDAVGCIIKTVEVFDDFCHANDPHQEHDFGSFEADGHTIFFKIDYYDKTLTRHSPDPADPAVTERVITILLAEEY